MSGVGGAAPAKGNMLQLSILSRSALYMSYLSFLKNGGLFIPTRRSYRLGDDLIVLLQLKDSEERTPVRGRVVWITPVNTVESRQSGVGIEFSTDDFSIQARRRIEEILGNNLTSARPTSTM